MIHTPSQTHTPGPYFLGVDGGGSKTLAVIVDATGNEQGRGYAGSANHQAVGADTALLHISQAIAAAAHQAACTLPVANAWFGLAGVDHPSDQALLTPLLQSFAHTIHLTNDAELVLSALPHTTGIALIAGTGSIALGQDAHGTSARAGGWGHLIGDEGSGYDLGRHCLQAVAQAADGRAQPTALTDLLFHAWRLQDLSEIIDKVYNHGDKAAIAALAPLVCSAASNGDSVAQTIVTNATLALTTAIVAVHRTLHFQCIQRETPLSQLPSVISLKGLHFSAQPLNLALGGGLLLHETDFRRQLIKTISAQLSLAEIVLVAEPASSAARGAITLT